MDALTLDQSEFAEFQRFRDARDLLPDEQYLEPVRDHIVKYGWHIQQVLGDAGRFGWSYSIGFADSLDHPDLVVFGLPGDVARVLLNDIGDALARGQRFDVGARYGDFLENVDVEFRATLARWHPAHFGRAKDWYNGDVLVWQVVIPDLQNRFPGDPGEEASRFQLLLFDDQPAPEPLSHPHTPIDVQEGWTVLVPDLVGTAETGWEERLMVQRGADPGSLVVASVPFVDHVGFGDEIEVEDAGEELRLTRVTKHAPVATVRLGILQGGEETQRRLSDLLDVAESNGVVWESPVVHWFFFGVPHHQYAWFLDQVEPLRVDGLASIVITRSPE